MHGCILRFYGCQFLISQQKDLDHLCQKFKHASKSRVKQVVSPIFWWTEKKAAARILDKVARVKQDISLNIVAGKIRSGKYAINCIRSGHAATF